MKKRNNLYYFESYDEIRAYEAQGYPSNILLTTRRSTILKDGQVIHPKTLCPSDKYYGTPASQQEIDNGCVSDPGRFAFKVVIGLLEDYPAEEYATYHDFVREVIHADTALEGFYQAGDLLAARLRTADGERRSSFTAKDMTTPVDKGGARVTWPYGGQEVLYTVTTATGRYEASEEQLFGAIADMEKVEGVGPAKCRCFTVPAGDTARKVLARLYFEADKALPKMKKCWDTDELRRQMMQPVIELKTGIIVVSDGHVLAAHKTQGYHEEVTGKLKCDKLWLPREVTQMKGTVTVEVTENKVGAGTELVITATDGKGRQGVVTQDGRYPNWRSVIPSSVGRPVTVDAAVWEKAVKQLQPHVPPSSELMKMDAERGAEAIVFSGEDYDLGKVTTVSVPVPDGVPDGLLVGVKASYLLKALAFAPTAMYFIGASRALLFLSDETLLIVMPMLIDCEPQTPRGPRDEDMVTFSLDGWIRKKAAKKKPAKASKPAAWTADKAQPVPSADVISLAERLRQALMKAA